MSDIATRAKLRADSEQKLRDAAFGALSEQETKEVTVTQENPTNGETPQGQAAAASPGCRQKQVGSHVADQAGTPGCHIPGAD